MAVATKHGRSKDKSNGRTVDVHYVTVTKTNRKGAAENFGGNLVIDGRHPNGWYIELTSQTAGGAPVAFEVMQGGIVFRTGTNKRYQVLERVEFKKRFPQITL